LNILHKAIFIIIAFSIFSFLFFVTFIANSFSSFEKPFYEKNEQWLFELIKNWENFSLSKEVSTNSWAILINKFNLSDKVIYSYWEVQTEYLSWALNITIKPWIYYFQLKEINTKYIISWDWFEIENKWPWKFIINNLNSRKNLVFSQDALLSLNLKHYKTNEDITSIALYPHSYLLFNPLKNIFVKNSDLLKISQIFTLWFFNEKINNSEDFLNKILINSSKWKELILNSIDYYNKEKNQKNIYINNYLDSTFWTLPWEVFINKYSKLFINPNKKSLYYKNIIIREIHDLLKSEIIDIKTINNINENLNWLKQIDIDWYESMKEFIKFNYINITIGEFKVNSKINFSKLLNKINNKNELYSIPSLIFLEQIFNNYNPDSIYFYNKINTFIKNNFDDYWISIDTSNNKKSIDEIKEIDYLLYFLENIILNSDLSSDSNTSEIINLFNNYINIANTFYLYSNDSIKRIWLFTNSKVLNKFIKIIETNYFESERKDELIILQEWVDIVKNDILLLEKNINSIFIFFNNNNIVLDLENSTKDKFLKEKLYPNLEKTYKEYFNALIDYDDYLAKYDINKKELLDTKTINENTNKIVLSIESAKEYISQFNWIQFKNTNIKIMDYIYCLNPIEENLNIELINPYCYKIENLNIDKLPTSFILYPFLNNKIDNIKVWNSLKSWSYKLDEVEIELEKKIKMAKDNKEQFEFENFLVNTFWRQVISNNNIATNTIDDEVFEQEDSVIRIFKRNKLLW